MIINATVGEKLISVFNRAKQIGTVKTMPLGVVGTTWEYCGILTSNENGICTVVTDKFGAQANGLDHGFWRGQERDLNNLLYELGIAAQ